MDTWHRYRRVWSAHWWVAVVFALAVICVLIGLVATFEISGFAALFIPGLLLAYGHHLLVTRKYR